MKGNSDSEGDKSETYENLPSPERERLGREERVVPPPKTEDAEKHDGAGTPVGENDETDDDAVSGGGPEPEKMPESPQTGPTGSKAMDAMSAPATRTDIGKAGDARNAKPDGITGRSKQARRGHQRNERSAHR